MGVFVKQLPLAIKSDTASDRIAPRRFNKILIMCSRDRQLIFTVKMKSQRLKLKTALNFEV